jgi:hypothetical protein
MKKFLLSLFFFILSLLTLSVLGAILYYSKWSNEFDLKAEEFTYLDLEIDRYGDIREDIDLKVNRFSSSENQVDFIEFTPEEFGILVYDNSSEAFPEDITVKEIYINHEIFEWYLYMNLEYKGVSLPWIGVEISKDNQETAEIYVSEVSVAGIILSDIGLESFRRNLSRGYLDALNFVNENNITERKFDNIELTDEGVFIKGSRKE